MEVVSHPLGVRIALGGAPLFFGILFFFASTAPLDSLVIRSVVLLVAAILAIRGFRVSIRADTGEIVVRNFFRTHRLRWEDVDMIGIGAGWSGRGTTNLIFLGKNERAVPATATMNRRREQTRVMWELAELRPDLPIRYFEAG